MNLHLASLTLLRVKLLCDNAAAMQRLRNIALDLHHPAQKDAAQVALELGLLDTNANRNP